MRHSARAQRGTPDFSPEHVRECNGFLLDMVRFGLSLPPPGSQNRPEEILRKFTGSFVPMDQEGGQGLAPMKIRVREHGRGKGWLLGPTATFHRFVVTRNAQTARGPGTQKMSPTLSALRSLPCTCLFVGKQAQTLTTVHRVKNLLVPSSSS